MRFPLRLDRPEALGGLRELASTTDFSERGVCDRLGLPSIYDFQTLRAGREGSADVADGLDLLIRLFMDGEGVRASRIEELGLSGGMRAVEALGLLGGHPRGPGWLGASALLYPTESLLISSDLNEQAPGISEDGGRLRRDSVYPAITNAAREFMSDLPLPGAGRVLDLCSGTGIGALALARGAEEVWAVDITERCTLFAEFNARLNGVHNIRILCGDLYEPLHERQFDLIVAHPPYVPSDADEFVFRDGGADGERIVRRILEGLPDHLAPGGLFYARCMATDRDDAPLERRIRSFLGARAEEFDVFVIPSREMRLSDYLSGGVRSGRMGFEEAESRRVRLEEAGVEAFVHGTLLVQRRAVGRPAVTSRRFRAPQAGPEVLDWLRRWEVARLDSGFGEAVLEMTPRLREGAVLELRYRVAGGKPLTEGLSVRSDGPFPSAFFLPADTAHLLSLFDGATPVREVFREGTHKEWIPPATREEEFVGLLVALSGGGVLELPGFEIPADT